MKKYLATLTCLCLTGGLTAFATTITPTGTALTTLAGATFGGSGIPNNAVEVTTVPVGQAGSITLGLTATQRYGNPPLANNGFGTFYATPGENTGLDGGIHSIGPTWNFDYYINAGNLTAYTFRLIYSDNTTGLSTTLAPMPQGQDSWNLDMSFLNTLGFSATAAGVYGFELDALNSDGHVVASSAINVNVGSVPDTASTAGLLGLGVIGIGLLKFRSTRLARAK